MPGYVRPPIPKQVFYDDSGGVIEYGNRWQGQPPEHAYSATLHPERFAPLQTVASALIEHLQGNYNVTVTEDDSLASELAATVSGGVRWTLRLVPANADGAPLTIAFTGFPGIAVSAGLLHDFVFPQCGCDACDDSIDALVEELEDLVLGVAEGRFREIVKVGSEPSIQYELRTARHGWQRGGRDVSSARERRAVSRLQALPNSWQAWQTLPEGV